MKLHHPLQMGLDDHLHPVHQAAGKANLQNTGRCAGFDERLRVIEPERDGALRSGRVSETFLQSLEPDTVSAA